MENILIFLIIFQALLVGIGYFALARQIHSTRRRLEVLGVMTLTIPLLGLLLKFLPGGINTEEFLLFIRFYVYSVIANGITGTVVEVIEHALLGGRQ